MHNFVIRTLTILLCVTTTLTTSLLASAEQETVIVKDAPADHWASDVLLPAQRASIDLLGVIVEPGSIARLSWSPGHFFASVAAATPVLVAHGAQPGPVLCLTAAVHGDELNGIEIIRRVFYDIDPQQLRGTIVAVPIVNLQGFYRNSRYLTDRRDLNRFFPGKPNGNSAERIAYSFFNEVIVHCNALVDIHTGSLYRTNLPQLRANMDRPEVVQLANDFDEITVLHSGTDNTELAGSLRHAAVAAGIPAVTLEVGESMILDPTDIDYGVERIEHLLHAMGMTGEAGVTAKSQQVYYHSRWVRTDIGGIFFTNVELGEWVDVDQALASVTDPISNRRITIATPIAGQIIGMARNQMVTPGSAVFHIAVSSTDTDTDDDIPQIEMHDS